MSTDPATGGRRLINTPAELQQVRESKGWSRLDVSQRTRFQVRQIAALENGDYDQLPGRAFVRAALRNYARELDVDVGPLLAVIGGHAQPAELTIQLRNSEAAKIAEMGAEYEPAPRSRASRLFWGGAGLVGVLALWLYVSGNPFMAPARQWFDGVFGADEAKSRVVQESAPGQVTETITWSWSSPDEGGSKAAAGASPGN